MRFRSLLLLTLFVATAAGGCTWTPAAPQGEGAPISWVEKDISHGETTVSFGYRGKTALVDGKLEPVASISKGDAADASAMVFVSVASGGETIVEEVATTYEAGEDTGIYTAGPLELPADASQCMLQFRIVATPGGEELTQEVAVDLKK